MTSERSDGSTQLDPDLRSSLIPALTTRAELDDFEARNILAAMMWARRARADHRDMLQPSTLRLLHRRMFDMTWTWAGQFRTVDTNLGVPWQLIPTQLEQLCGNVRFQIEHDVFGWNEISARFHHQLVSIHPFVNGNGRHARLATDLLRRRHGLEPFRWGRDTDPSPQTIRRNYLAALRLADSGDISALIQFASGAD